MYIYIYICIVIASANVVHPVYDSSRPRITQIELTRYLRATEEAMVGQVLALSGPDGTKVGTDLFITMSALMNPDTGLVAVAAPQVQLPRGRSNYLPWICPSHYVLV